MGFVQDAAAFASSRTGVVRVISSRPHGPGPLGRASYVHRTGGSTVSASCSLLDEDAGTFATCASVLEWMTQVSVTGPEKGAEGCPWRWRTARMPVGTNMHVYAPSLRPSHWVSAAVVAVAWIPSVSEALARLEAVSWLKLRDSTGRGSGGHSLPRGALLLCRVAEAERSRLKWATGRSVSSLPRSLASLCPSREPCDAVVGAAVVAAASPMALLAPWLLSAGATTGIVSALVLGQGCDGQVEGSTPVVLSDARMAGEAEGGLALVDTGSTPGQPRWAAFLIAAPLCWAQDREDLACMVDRLSPGRGASAEAATAAASRLLDRVGTHLQPWVQGCGASAALVRERPLLPLAGLATVLHRLFPKEIPHSRDGASQCRLDRPPSRTLSPAVAAASAAAATTVAILHRGRWGSGFAIAHPRLVLTCAHVLGPCGGLLQPGEAVSPVFQVACSDGRQANARVLWCGGNGTRASATKGGVRTPCAALDAAVLLVDRPVCALSELPRVGEGEPEPGHPASVCGYGLYPPRHGVGPIVTGGAVSKVRGRTSVPAPSLARADATQHTRVGHRSCATPFAERRASYPWTAPCLRAQAAGRSWSRTADSARWWAWPASPLGGTPRMWPSRSRCAAGARCGDSCARVQRLLTRARSRRSLLRRRGGKRGVPRRRWIS